MRQYELTYLISDTVSEPDLTKVTGKIGGFVAENNGKILKEEIWKRRKLAYAINKQEFATYVTLNFELPADKAAHFEREVRLTPQVIRHLMIVRDYGTEELSLTLDEIADTQDIEEVVGGEKSFEAVEGETEESKDLMAVREKEEEEAEETEQPAETKEKTEETKDEAVEAKEETKSEEPAEKEAEEKPAKPKRTKPRVDSEADRLAKLDEQLDNLLNDEL